MRRRTLFCLVVLTMGMIISGCENKNVNNNASYVNDYSVSETHDTTVDNAATSVNSSTIWDELVFNPHETGVIHCDIIDNAVPVEISILGTEEIEKIINAAANLHASDHFYYNAPQTAILAAYIDTAYMEQDFESYYNDFLTLYEYLFPGRVVDNEYLLYDGGESKLCYDENGNRVQDLHKVEDWYDDLVAGKEGMVSFLYDENWYGEMVEWKSPVCLEIGTAVGYGYTIINKGKAVQISGKVRNENRGYDVYPILESYDPADYFYKVASYSPKSTASYKLLDKEVPINEAVAFFEQYINNLPCPQESNLSTKVVAVDVLKLNNDAYGYYFLTTKDFYDVPFDYMRSGTSHSSFDYSFYTGNAFMVESSDIDVLYGYYRLQLIHSPKVCQTCISPAEAIGLVSKRMTQNIDFEVQSIELVYSMQYITTKEGYIDIESGYPCKDVPSWKLTLFNANDSLSYVCYVNAEDGGNFRYFASPQDMELLE